MHHPFLTFTKEGDEVVKIKEGVGHVEEVALHEAWG